MAKTLYLDGANGISGDMFVAALLDLGGSREKLDRVLGGLGIGEFRYEIGRKSSHGIAGLDFEVRTGRGQAGGDCRGLPPGDRHDDDGRRGHAHRGLADVYAVIDRGAMAERAREIAKRTFRIVAEAEAEAHGLPLQEVRFHEVGAVDSIVDIVSAAVLVDDLDIGDVIVTGFSEGHGHVHCRHGDLPVPVPAVLNIARAYGIGLSPAGTDGEMVTPTGIALAAALRTRSILPAKYKVAGVGVGLGKRDFGRPNFFRALLLDAGADGDRVYVVECAIDDSTGEELGHAMETLFRQGALDVRFMPCFGKKNRPSWLVRVLAKEPLLGAIEKTLFHETSTIGVRRYPVERTVMERERVVLALPYGAVEAKRVSFEDVCRVVPEFESVRATAERTGRPFPEVMSDAREAGLRMVRGGK